MSAMNADWPVTSTEALRDGWGDELYRCIECGGYYDPDEVSPHATQRGPECSHCHVPDHREHQRSEGS